MINDKKFEKFKIYIHKRGENWVNVTDRKAILYGAGYGLFKLNNHLQYLDIAYIIDHDIRKINSDIQILNQNHIISSPDILSTIDWATHFIIITSSKYKQEISNDLTNYLEHNNYISCTQEELFYCYETLEELLYYDPIVNQGLTHTNMSLYKDDIISKYKTAICKSGLKEELFFFPLQTGNKFCFLFGDLNESWIFSIPGKHSELEIIKKERDNPVNRLQRYYIKQKLKIDDEITIFEDENGVLIQKYAEETIDYTDIKKKKEILNTMNFFHNFPEKIAVTNDMFTYYYSNLANKIFNLKNEKLKEIIREMDMPLQLLKNIETNDVLCHCDLHCGNLVSYNGTIFIIDWEYLGMSDPMYDVCSFLVSVGQNTIQTQNMTYHDAMNSIYNNLRYDLSLYYGRPCSNEEFVHAYIVMLICECRELFIKILYEDYNSPDEIINTILQHIKNFNYEK